MILYLYSVPLCKSNEVLCFFTLLVETGSSLSPVDDSSYLFCSDSCLFYTGQSFLAKSNTAAQSRDKTSGQKVSHRQMFHMKQSLNCPLSSADVLAKDYSEWCLASLLELEIMIFLSNILSICNGSCFKG